MPRRRHTKIQRKKHIPYRQPQKDAEHRIFLKDVVIPIVTAIIVVIFQQLFFEENKRVESSIELKMTRLNAQLPTLNRILIFTDQYSIAQRTVISIPTQIKEVRNVRTNELISSEEIPINDQADTTLLSTPTFVMFESDRKKFLDDLKEINSKKGVLDYHIYLEVENIVEFLDKNPLPNIDSEAILKSSWNKKETIEEWDQLVTSAYTMAYYAVYYPEIDYRTISNKDYE